jgi:hypothetical protein
LGVTSSGGPDPAEHNEPTEQSEPTEQTKSADKLLATALQGLAAARRWFGEPVGRDRAAVAALRSAVQTLSSGTEPETGFLDSTVSWTTVIGGLGAIALRAASAATPEDERAALVSLLEAVADTPLAEPDGRWREVTLNHAGPLSDIRLGAVLSTGAGRAIVLDAASWSRENPQLRLLEYAPYGNFGTVPGGTVVSFRPSIGWGGHGDLAEFLVLLRDRGPVRWRREAVTQLSEATGMPRALAALLLAGLPRAGFTDPRVLPKHTRDTLKLKVAEVGSVQRTIADLDQDQRILLCDNAMPKTPAQLWDQGPDVQALAACWNRIFGRRVAIAEPVIAGLGAVLNDANAGRFARRAADLLQGLADPDNCPWLNLDRHWSIRDGQLVGEGEPEGFGPDELLAVTTALPWLAEHLKPTDPLRAQLPAVHARLQERLRNPELIVRVQSDFPLAGVREAFGHPKPARRKKAPAVLEVLPLGAAGILVVKPDWPEQMFVRPHLLTADDPVLTAGHGVHDSVSDALRRVADPEFARLMTDLDRPVGAGPTS